MGQLEIRAEKIQVGLHFLHKALLKGQTLLLQIQLWSFYFMYLIET